MKKLLAWCVVSGALLYPSLASAAEESSSVDSGHTAWIMTATALVLFMTIPGLSLFYGGLVRAKNVLSVLMHCFAITCVMSVVWLIIGYSLAFSGSGGWIGNLDAVFLKGITPESAEGAIPDILFVAFQMTFFIITPALMVGAFVERMKFSAVLLFTTIWALVVYAPVCHMVWDSDGWLYKMGVIDLAGGIVVHITAGLSALVACIMVGKRKDTAPPHNLPFTIAGTAMLWVGWFGFNGGSGLAANGFGAMSIFVTHISAATAALTWMVIEWCLNRKPTVLGIVTGSIGGLAAITPASGVAGPMGALVIGAASGALCWWFSVKIKARFGYDDSLDVFGVHGIGGIVGTLLAAIVAAPLLGGVTPEGFSMGGQLKTQAIGVVFTIVFAVILTFVILKIVSLLCGGLRVDEAEEHAGIDQTDHGESGYSTETI